MHEPSILQVPLSLLFLYFVWYSFWGWAMETAYTSWKERHFVVRGFLFGPVCPIYGVGALIMALFFRPMTGYPVVLYLTACVVMTGWEYLVGWFLELTTHMKYWDYSDRKLNLKGRVCLSVGLFWGVAAFATIYWIHPATQALFSRLTLPLRWWIAGGLAGVMLADSFVTIRKLALATRFLGLAEQSWKEIHKRRQELVQAGRQAAETARLQAALAAMELRYSDQIRQAARYTLRFRRRYLRLSTDRYKETLSHIRSQVAEMWEGHCSLLKKR